MYGRLILPLDWAAVFYWFESSAYLGQNGMYWRGAELSMAAVDSITSNIGENECLGALGTRVCLNTR